MADRVMSGLGCNINSKSTSADLKKNLLEAGSIINKSKFEEIAQNTLLPTGFKIREEAVELISNAIQQLAKNVLESAIVNNRRRRGTYVVNAYNNIQQVLSRYNGSVIPECRMNIGIRWEADKKSQLKNDIEKSNNTLKSKLDELEQALLKRMKEFDEERSIVGRKKPPLPGQERFQELWWVRDVIIIYFYFYFYFYISHISSTVFFNLFNIYYSCSVKWNRRANIIEIR